MKRVRLQHLFEEGDLGDQRRPQLLHRMRQLLEEHDASIRSMVLRELFLQSFTQPIHFVLAAAGDANLDRLAELADQVHEATAPSVYAVSPPTHMAISRREDQINELPASKTALQSPLQGTDSPFPVIELFHTRKVLGVSALHLCARTTDVSDTEPRVQTSLFVAGKRSRDH